MVRVVVTGAAGFIGSHLARALTGAGHVVHAVDLPTAVNWPMLAALDGVVTTMLDVTTGPLTPLLAPRPEALVHLAALPGVRSSFGVGEAATINVNVDGTRRLAAACSAAGVPMLLASSSSVYGPARGRPQRETDRPRPASPYAVSKLRAERIVASAAGAGLPTAVLRYFTVYGSRQRADMAVHRFVAAALAGRPLPVLGDLAQGRAFTHVTDIVAGTVAALDGLLRGAFETGAVFNLGAAEPVSLRSLIDVLAGVLQRDLAIDHRAAAPGDVPLTWADTSAAGKVLGWSARVGLREGLVEQVAWHRTLPWAELTVG